MSEHRIQSLTFIGLALSFLGAPLVVFLVNTLAPGPYTDTTVILKELSILALGLVLLVIIKKENLTPQSIGLHSKHWGKSILIALLIAVILFAVLIAAVAILSALGIQLGGDEGSRYESVSLWTMLLVVFRAGVIEELFYRGYLMERLNSLSSGNKFVYFVLPLVVFALVHYTQGWPGIFISFVAGLVLAISYWKTRDLKANMLAHFLVDLVPNVIIPLFAEN